MFRLTKNALSLSKNLKSVRPFSSSRILKNVETYSFFNDNGNNNSIYDDKKKDLMRTYTNSKISYATSVSDFHLVADKLSDIVERQAELLPSKMVYGFPHQKMNLTFSEVKQRVDSMKQSFLNLGLQKGDRIAFALPNTHELVICFLAAAELGLISVVLNPAYQLVEFEYMLKKTNVKALFIYDTFKVLNHIGLVQKLCPEIESSLPGELKSKNLPDLKHVIVLNSPLSAEKKTYNGTWQYSEFSKANSQNSNQELPYVDIEDPCLILFTSGTTGKPKGAVMNQYNLLNSAYLSTAVVGNFDGLRMICNPIPFFHIMGFSTGILIPLLMGTSIVFPFYFPDILASIKAIEAYKCNTIRGTPTQYIDLINHPERKNHNISSLENGIVGGSTVPPDLLQKMTDVLNIKEIIVGYGMTETSLCHTVTSVSDKYKSSKFAYESVGRPIPFTETKIINPATGQIMPLNTDGEILIRGPHVINEYWDEKEKTMEAIDKHGWLRTGDIGQMDEHGYIYFKSRNKDLIIRGGANLYPAEIESFIRTHPSIVDAQVFGVPDERHGEEVCAWIKVKEGEKLTEEDIKAFCKGNISHFKIPRYIKFVDAFPINANQKVLKMVMREKAIAELNLKK